MRILIAEKNRAFRAGFVELVTHCHPNWRIVETADAVEFLARMAASRFDVVFLDLQLPGLDARLNLGALRAEHPHTKVIGLGETNDSSAIIRCFEQGLGGYIARTSSGINLIRTLKVIATPDLFISTGGCEPAPLQAPRPPEPAIAVIAPRDPEAHPLTARQADVLHLLAEGRSTKDIARRLGLAVPTVKTHLAAVYRQLGARNRLQAVVKAGAIASSATMPNAHATAVMMRAMARSEMFEQNFAAG